MDRITRLKNHLDHHGVPTAIESGRLYASDMLAKRNPDGSSDPSITWLDVTDWTMPFLYEWLGY